MLDRAFLSHRQNLKRDRTHLAMVCPFFPRRKLLLRAGFAFHSCDQSPNVIDQVGLLRIDWIDGFEKHAHIFHDLPQRFAIDYCTISLCFEPLGNLFFKSCELPGLELCPGERDFGRLRAVAKFSQGLTNFRGTRINQNKFVKHREKLAGDPEALLKAAGNCCAHLEPPR